MDSKDPKKKKKHKKSIKKKESARSDLNQFAKSPKINLTYDFDRYDEGASPMTVYYPSPDLLFKLMKACIGCDNIKDLWIYNEDFNADKNLMEQGEFANDAQSHDSEQLKSNH